MAPVLKTGRVSAHAGSTPVASAKKKRKPRRPPTLRILPSGYAVLIYASGKRRHEHRMVFFKKAGQGPMPCHWCGKVLFRMRGVRYHPDKILVDHLNRIRHDNRPENLVAACQRCNVTRTDATIPFLAQTLQSKSRGARRH